MRIASIHLKNFKRFTDLVIRDIPSSAKLVVVVGPNGCGKSSLFDALIQWNRNWVGFGVNSDANYYRKDIHVAFNFTDSVLVSLHQTPTASRGTLYVRTAYRNDPDFSVTGINRPDNPADNVRINRAIDNDQTVSDNYRRLVYDTMSGVYDDANDAKTVRVLREELIGDVRKSMRNVFGDLLLNGIADPLGVGTFTFEKGSVKSYQYKNLSGGEKAAFDLLLDLHIKKRFYSNAIYCIDELETHLHTRVQGLLLKEMVSVLPDQCQLWLATHSLGVLRATQQLITENPTLACLIDFEGVDPDVPRELVPSDLGRAAWEKFMSIALDDLSSRVAPKHVVVCEGSTVGNRRKDFDASIYSKILGASHPDVVFVSGGSSNQVQASGVSVKELYTQVIPSAKVISLSDLDSKSLAEVATCESNGMIVLERRNLESYLFADDVIEALVEREQKPEFKEQALGVVKAALANSVSRGNAANDLKSAAGEIYTELKKLLGLQRCGNNTDAFMRDTLAPLVLAPMQTYQSLKTAVIDKLTR